MRMIYEDNPQAVPSLYWDLQSFGVLNADVSLASTTQTTPFPDSSTGYLEDAIFQWNDRCKKRRMLFFPHEQTPQSSDSLLQDCGNADYNKDPFLNFSYLSQASDVNKVSDHALNSSITSQSSQESLSIEMKRQEERESAHEHLSSLSSSYKGSGSENSEEKENLTSTDPTYLENNRGLKKIGARVAYPFAVVKPGGLEGDVTLNDINRRILMPPTRPVRHPVGNFACVPCVSVNGRGLSGKAVVALTRIHTQGRGTITIIKTRG